MPRIIAGWAGSLALTAPASGTRPTADRVREALFSALEAQGVVEDAVVADLYAGSGALGLEAVSRGAASAVLVDRAPAAVKAMRANVAALRRAAPAGAPLQVEVQARAVSSWLATATVPPTLVLLDPPYDLDEAALSADLASVARIAATGATVVVERSARSPAPDAPGLALERDRTYGDTRVWTFSVPPVLADQEI